MFASEQFQALLRDHVKPVLKEHGFKRKGSNFSLRGTESWAVINFQKDRYCTALKVSFTINLGISSDLLARFNNGFAETVIAPNEPYCQWRRRIGHFDRGGPGLYGARGPEVIDRWWTLDDSTEFLSVVDDVLSVLRAHAVPELLKRMPDRALLETCREEALRSEHCLRGTEFGALLHALATRDEFLEFAAKELRDCTNKPWESTWRRQFAKLT